MKYYGPNGSYGFFAGKDGSRAFHTGEFSTGVVDDISGLNADAMKSLWSWVQFYREHSEYRFVGVLVDSLFFDTEVGGT